MKTTLHITKILAVSLTCLWLAGCILPADRGGYGNGRHQDRHGDDRRSGSDRGYQNRGDWDHGYPNRGNGYGN